MVAPPLAALDELFTFDDDSFRPFLLSRRPVVLRGALAHSTPVQTWTLASLRERFGDVVVSMAGHEEPDLVVGPTIDALLTRERDGGPPPPYLRNVFIAETMPALVPEVELPFFAEGNLLTQPFLKDAIPQAWTRWIELFLSGRGMRFPRIHADTHQTHAWLLQVQGEKRVWLWPPRRRSQRARIEDNLVTVDIDDDTDVTQALGHAPPITGVFGPGDVLFIPAGWWHTVEALGLSITLSGNFVVEENLDDFVAFNRFVIEAADPEVAGEVLEIARRVVAACEARAG